MRSTIRHCLATLAAAVMIAACSGSSSDAGPRSDKRHPGRRDVDYVMQALRDRGDVGASTPIRSLTFFLPNTFLQYEDSQDAPRRWSDDTGVVVVRGHVTDVAPGRAIRELPDDGGQVEVPVEEFLADQSKASWWTAHLELAVDEVFGGLSLPKAVPVGLAFGAGTDYEKARAGLMGMDAAVFPLDPGSAVFAYDPERWAVVADGRWMAVVGDSGALSLPGEEPLMAEQLLGEVPTVEALRAAAEVPGRLVTVERHGTIEYFRSVEPLTAEEAAGLSALSEGGEYGGG